MIDGYNFIGSSGTSGMLIFEKNGYRIIYNVTPEVSATISKYNSDGCIIDVKKFDRLEKAIHYVDGKEAG